MVSDRTDRFGDAAHYGDPFGEQRALAANQALGAGKSLTEPNRTKIGRWAREAIRIAAGQPGPVDVTQPGEQIAFLYLDGSENVLPQPGDPVTGNSDGGCIGRVTSVANHYELGPIALATLATPWGAQWPVILPQTCEVETAENGKQYLIAANAVPLGQAPFR